MRLLPRLRKDVLLHGVLRDQAVDVNLLRLTNAVAAVLCLSIHGRVPVRVVEYDGVCAGEVDSNATGAC